MVRGLVAAGMLLLGSALVPGLARAQDAEPLPGPDAVSLPGPDVVSLPGPDAVSLPGQRLFGQCKACHAVGPAARNGIGPQLNGLFGRRAGGVEGYAYSEANKGAGFVWDDAVFAEYIRDPKAKISGTKMQYAGLKNAKQVADLVEYLKTFGADGSAAK